MNLAIILATSQPADSITKAAQDMGTFHKIIGVAHSSEKTQPNIEKRKGNYLNLVKP